MKRVLRWCIYVLVALIALLVILILSIDTVARNVAEKRITAETGMETHIGSFHLSLRDRSVRIEGLRIMNSAEFGGDTFVHIPELYVEVDPEALREQNKVHMKTVRVNVAEMHVVENKDGKKNTDVFQKHGETSPKEPSSKPKQDQTKNSPAQVEFGGIDLLDVSLGHVKYTNERYPVQSFDRDIGITNRVFTNLKTQKELQTASVILAMQAGLNLFSQGKLSNPVELLKKGSSAGKEAGSVLKSLAAPFKQKK